MTIYELKLQYSDRFETYKYEYVPNYYRNYSDNMLSTEDILLINESIGQMVKRMEGIKYCKIIKNIWSWMTMKLVQVKNLFY